ncbi:MAG TPA: methyltransferase domain-containing protein [Gemmataceae bacterium]|nr:methyltransferase domain-containing protein [Gemmataceae bacterium]
MWDANQYLRYAHERSRPFFDLMAQVETESAETIADLGCGPGHLTRTLAERWPAATILGVDNSPEMLEQARALAIPGRLEFVQADIATWRPDRPLDLLVSNAALQWLPDHERLFATLAAMLAPGGTLAVQMPYHFNSPAHRVIDETVSDSRWQRLAGLGLHADSVKPLTWYVERLHGLGFQVNAWETTYLHVLTGEDAVLDWLKGTALRPLLAALAPEESGAFLRDVGGRLQAAFPPVAVHTLFPFARIFFVAALADSTPREPQPSTSRK